MQNEQTFHKIKDEREFSLNLHSGKENMHRQHSTQNITQSFNHTRKNLTPLTKRGTGHSRNPARHLTKIK